MKRTTISLPDDLAAALEREARRRRVPVSQVAREAIEARLGWDEEGPREIPFAGIGASEGPGNLSEYIDSDEFKKEYADWIYADAFGRDP
jgi:predicted transcriptional regulator